MTLANQQAMLATTSHPSGIQQRYALRSYPAELVVTKPFFVCFFLAPKPEVGLEAPCWKLRSEMLRFNKVLESHFIETHSASNFLLPADGNWGKTE